MGFKDLFSDRAAEYRRYRPEYPSELYRFIFSHISRFDRARRENIEYLVSPSESTPIPMRSVDLVTVAQALHWFEYGPFYTEVRRVSHEGAVIAAWAYGLLSVSPEADPIIQRFTNEVVARFWPKERGYVQRRYETIPFPFERMGTPRFTIEKEASLRNFLGDVSTWSAVQKCAERTGSDPVEILAGELAPVWSGKEEKTLRWPLYLLMGKVNL